VRGQNLLEVWVKRNNENIELWNPLSKLFISGGSLSERSSTVLGVNYSSTVDYGINIGITVLEGLLKSTGLGSLGLNGKFGKKGNVSISFDNARKSDVSSGDVSDFFNHDDFDFCSENQELLTQANNNNLILITGIIYAQELKVHIKTEKDFDVNLVGELKEIAKADISFKSSGTKELEMVAPLGEAMPIAIKATRLHFRKGKYVGNNLVTDTRDFDW
jgi:hypothetical protein